MIEKNVVGTGNKDDQFPVFKSDIMDEKENAIRPVAPASSASSVSAVNAAVSSNDPIEQWRQMSEMYKKRRLAKEKLEKLRNDDSQEDINNLKTAYHAYQKDYEKDSLNLSGPPEKQKLLDEVMKKLWMANLDVDHQMLVSPETEEMPISKDGILRVSDVMSRNVTSVIDSMNIEQVASIFNKKNITGVPVVHYLSKNLMGVITMSDIVSHIFDNKKLSSFHTEGTVFQQDSLAILEKPVRSLMNTDIIQVAPDCTVQEACKIMAENSIHRVIVTENDKVKGIFTTFDAVKILAELEISHPENPDSESED